MGGGGGWGTQVVILSYLVDLTPFGHSAHVIIQSRFHSPRYPYPAERPSIPSSFNLVSRILRLFGQWLIARRDSGVLEFYYRRISAVKRYKKLRGSKSKKLFFFRILQSLSWRPIAGQRPEDSWARDWSSFNLVPRSL